MFLKNYTNKWKKKKTADKISDVLFFIFLVALLIPQSRTAITVSVKRLVAFPPKIDRNEEEPFLNESDYNWEMETLSGDIVNLKEYRGRTIFINEWATWCPPCIAEMPSIEKLYRQLKDDPSVIFIIVSSEELPVVRDFIIENGYTFPVLISRSPTPSAFYSGSIPTTFIVSSAGKVVLKEKGSKKWHGEETVKFIQSLNN